MPEANDPQSAVETPLIEALIEAIETHDEKEVKRLIAARVDVEEVDGQGRKALICAVQNNNLSIIKALVEDGNAIINANDPRYDNRNSLFYAVTKSTETASYLFEKVGYFNVSDVHNILEFFIEDLCTPPNRHRSGPEVVDILRILQENVQDLTPELLATELARSIANVLQCNISLLLTPDSHRPQNSQHTMFHLHEKRNFLLDILKKVSEFECFENNYSQNEDVKRVISMIRERSDDLSGILNSLKEHGSDADFVDSYGNTALHYAACLPWKGVSQETTMEICEQLCMSGVPPNAKNHLGQSPLLFCLSGSMRHLEEENKVAAMETLVEVCMFLVARGSSLTETSKNGESVFHLVMKLFQQGLEIPEQTIRKGVIDETMKLLHSFTPSRVNNIVQKRGGDLLNSPLHLWASLALTVHVKDYTSNVTQEHTFETIMEVILNHLVECGALKNDRNKEEETPLHLCTTWSAVTLLIGIDVNKDDLDKMKRPPLLAAANKKTFLRNHSRFYPDVKEDAYSFFQKAVNEKQLDPWAFHKHDESVLGILIASDAFDLSKALVDVARDVEDSYRREIFISLLKAICRDESLHTHWKIELVKTILEYARERNMDVVDEPFDVCCNTMVSQLSNRIGNGPSRLVEVPRDALVQPSSDNGQIESDDPDDDEPSPPDERIDEQLARLESTIHCKIAKVLRSYGAKLFGQSYERLRTRYNEINNILQPETEVEVLIPWTSRSKRHKPVLEKVARRQECQEITESICCHRPPGGSFGADPLVGINKQNSKEVSIKRIEEAQCTQELKNLYAELDCEQVIRYFLHLEDSTNRIVYIVFELMEGNLDDYLKGDAFDSSKGTSLCRDIVRGLNYLHKNDVFHFQDHLKPTSIFYTTHPNLCLKITDFDHQPANETTIHVWSSPEVLTTGVHDGTKSSDVFCCGLLLHYILSNGKHPFSTDCTNSTETECNIRGNKRKVDDSLTPEGANLVEEMLRSDRTVRPTAAESLNHPLFWLESKKVDFLSHVGNQPAAEYSRTGKLIDLEKQFGTIVQRGDWKDSGYEHMHDIFNEMNRWRKYDTRSVVDLVRFIRNAYAHVSESTRPAPIRIQLLEDFVFFEYFPNLVIEVYKWVVSCKWHQTREEIKYALRK